MKNERILKKEWINLKREWFNQFNESIKAVLLKNYLTPDPCLSKHIFNTALNYFTRDFQEPPTEKRIEGKYNHALKNNKILILKMLHTN